FIVGRRGSGPGEFFRPTALAYDANSDRVFVTDKDNHRVQVLDSRGHYLFSFGSKGHRRGQFSFPWGLAVSPDGSLIAVADTRNHRIQFFNAAGRFQSEFSVANRTNWREFKSVFNYPRGLAFNLKGDALYITAFILPQIFQLQ